MKIQGVKSIQNIYKEKKIENVVDLLKPVTKPQRKEDNTIGALLVELEEEQRKVNKIAEKIARGESINSEEYKYIKETNPNILDKASEANNLRKRLEHEISSAKTKEEADAIISKAKELSFQPINTNEKNAVFIQKLSLVAIEKAQNNSNINSKETKIDKDNKEDKDRNKREGIDTLV